MLAKKKKSRRAKRDDGRSSPEPSDLPIVPAPLLPADLPSDTAPLGSPAAALSDADIAIPELDSSIIIEDEPLANLPDISGRAVVGAPESPDFKSKLPPINPGAPGFVAEEKEKPVFEQIIFKITWAGIFFLIGVEIFINTPLFQKVKPFLQDRL